MTGPALPDIQDSFDDRGIELDHVGISDVRFPTTFDDGEVVQSGIATCTVTVTLPHDRRGTHMSRMVQLLEDDAREIRPQTVSTLLKSAQDRLNAEAVTIDIALPIALTVAAPATGSIGHQVHDLVLTASRNADKCQLNTTLTVDVTSLCPCSKAISDYGAHNQRSRVTVTVTGMNDDLYPTPVRRIVDLVLKAGSCPVYPVVKRPDERHITMAAFDNPVFVEDIVRSISHDLRQTAVQHEVQATNIESIHSHNAYASVAWTQ